MLVGFQYIRTGGVLGWTVGSVGAYGENPTFHSVAEMSLSLRSKGVFYYSVPTLDFLHKHLRVKWIGTALGIQSVSERLKAPIKAN